MPQEKPKRTGTARRKPQAPGPDVRRPVQYPSETLEGIRETGLWRDTIAPVLGAPRISTPPFVPAGSSTIVRGRAFGPDSVHVYNVGSEPSQHINTLTHEVGHTAYDRGRGFDAWGLSEEQDAAHTGYGLQLVRLMNEGKSEEEAMRIVQEYSRGKTKMIPEATRSAAEFWRRKIPTTEQLERNRRTTVPGSWEQLYDRTNEIRTQISTDAYSRPIRRPSPPTTDSWNRPVREGVRANDARGNARTPWLGGAETRADTAAAYQNMYHTSGEMTDAIVAAARKHEIELPEAFGLIDVESNFRQDQESGVGAVGLTQVRPEYAGKEQGYTEEELRRDPIANLDAGMGFYRRMKDATETPEDALDAYNRGLSAHRAQKRRGYARKVLGE